MNKIYTHKDKSFIGSIIVTKEECRAFSLPPIYRAIDIMVRQLRQIDKMLDPTQFEIFASKEIEDGMYKFYWKSGHVLRDESEEFFKSYERQGYTIEFR